MSAVTAYPIGARTSPRSGGGVSAPVHSSLERADTTLADVEGLLHGARVSASASWPLVDAVRQRWGPGQPLTTLRDIPTVEVQNLEKGPLTGTTVHVDAFMGTPVSVAVWTDISRQAAANPSALRDITDILAATVAADVDRRVAAALVTAAGAASADSPAALAALARWPGRRLIVLGADAVAEWGSWIAFVASSGGAAQVVIDPYITSNFVIALAGVAVGVIGPTPLVSDEVAHLGIDVAHSVTYAVQAAVGAVKTWTSTVLPGGWGGAGGAGGAGGWV